MPSRRLLVTPVVSLSPLITQFIYRPIHAYAVMWEWVYDKRRARKTDSCTINMSYRVPACFELWLNILFKFAYGNSLTNFKTPTRGQQSKEQQWYQLTILSMWIIILLLIVSLIWHYGMSVGQWMLLSFIEYVWQRPKFDGGIVRTISEFCGSVFRELIICYFEWTTTVLNNISLWPKWTYY